MTRRITLTAALILLVLANTRQPAHAEAGSIVGWGSMVLVPQEELTDVVAVAAGWYHGLALKSDGSIVARGKNYDGQCKLPTPNSDFVALAAGASRSLGLKSDGSIVAWGRGGVPVPNEDFHAVAAGMSHSLGLKGDGSVVAWGDNYSGQCNVPEFNRDFVAVAGGASHSRQNLR